MTTLILCALVSAVSGVAVGFWLGRRDANARIAAVVEAEAGRRMATYEDIREMQNIDQMVREITNRYRDEYIRKRERARAEIDRKHNNQRSEQ